MSSNVVWHSTQVSRLDRENLNHHVGVCIWFTGLSASGKSTIAVEVEKVLHEAGFHTYILDGDNMRHGLNKDLGFSDEARTENIRRIGEVAKLFVDSGTMVLSAFISPFKKDRDFVRNILPEGRFVEVFVDADLKTCEERDPKKLYVKARKGEISDFTGITSPYEAPENPEVWLSNNNSEDLNSNVQKIIQYLKDKKLIKKFGD